MNTNDSLTSPAADIIVVDDETGSRRLLTEILSKAGYRVRPADGPQVALESVLAHPPSLILLDVKMPEMNGFEVCRRLKQVEHTCEIPIIFVSALQDVEDRIQGFEAGGVDFVSKPFEESEVLARVKTHLQLRDMQLHLEGLVAERTAELTRTNESLWVEISERKSAQQALRESEKKYRTVVEHAIEGILIMQDGQRKYCNPRWLEMTGYSAEEYEKKPFLSLVHSDDLEIVEKEYQNLLTGQKFGILPDFRIITKSGDIKWLSTRGSRIQWEDKPAGMVFIEDITQRKQAEQTIRQSHQRLIKAQQVASMGFLDWDLKTNGMVWSQETYDLFGVDPEVPVTIEQTVELVHPEDREHVDENLNLAIQGLREYKIDHRIVRPDGQVIWVQARADLALDDQGQPATLLGTVVDITQRKQAEEKLRNSEERFHSLFVHMLNGIALCQIIVDENNKPIDFIYLEVNDAFEKLTGLRKEDILGKKATEVFSGFVEEYSILIELYGRVALTGEGERLSIHFKPLDSWLYISVYSTQKGYFTAVFENITARKQAEQDIQAYQQKLKLLAAELTLAEERERRRIAAGLHDDVAQTLAFTRVQLARARKATAEPKVSAILDDVSESIRQTIQDTRDLVFDLSSPLLNEIGLAAALAEWLEEQVEKKHGLQTEFIDAGQNIVLDEDVRAILFRNVRELLNNVVRHAQAGKVSVRLECVGDTAIVAIEDDGNGFDPLAAAEATDCEGGFGLFSIRERMLDLGGTLEIVSEPGQGCTAILTVPLSNG